MIGLLVKAYLRYKLVRKSKRFFDKNDAAVSKAFLFLACISGGSRFLASQSFACYKSHA
jgi:hypothetical protein